MDEVKILLAHVNDPDQSNIDIYIKNNGYKAVEKALKTMKPADVIEEVKKSELKGRGGAGFLTGSKWAFIPTNPELDKYLVCNADESEPGTFKDRLIMEKDPHQLIEGVILASYAIGAKLSFIYCRGEYFESLHQLRKALSEAEEKGFVGQNILGTDYSLRIVIHPGAGAYIAGEETAQLNSLEGYRATPRLKPPFPAIAGLYGMPTIINNVETLCNVVHIINNGADAFKANGKPGNYGTKIYQISGQIAKPGCYEFPIGVPLSDVIRVAGGMLPGRKFKACYPGGSSCSLLVEKDINIPLDFTSLAERGTALGTASIIIMDDTADMVKVAHRLMEFYQNESCGKCTPCREGTRWVVQILARIARGEGAFSDLKVIKNVCDGMAANSFCPLAVGAAPPIVSAIKEFPEEFEASIKQNPDADKPPKMKIAYPYFKSI